MYQFKSCTQVFKVDVKIVSRKMLPSFKGVLNLEQSAKVAKIGTFFYVQEFNLISSKVIKFHFIPYFKISSTVY